MISFRIFDMTVNVFGVYVITNLKKVSYFFILDTFASTMHSTTNIS